MATELADQWHPSNADYAQGNSMEGWTGGLIALSAFAMIGIGAFFAVGAGIGEGITVGGTTYYGVSQATAEALAAIGEGAMTVEAANTVTSAAIMGGGSAFDAAAVIALYSYDVSSPRFRWHYGRFGAWMGYFTGLGVGGFSTPPGFPDFPGHGFPMGGAWVCYTIDEYEYCFYTYE